MYSSQSLQSLHDSSIFSGVHFEGECDLSSSSSSVHFESVCVYSSQSLHGLIDSSNSSSFHFESVCVVSYSIDFESVCVGSYSIEPRVEIIKHGLSASKYSSQSLLGLFDSSKIS